jgi:hypothetical protein
MKVMHPRQGLTRCITVRYQIGTSHTLLSGEAAETKSPFPLFKETDTFKEFSEKAAFDAYKIFWLFSQSPLSLQLCKNGLEHYGTASDTSDK